MKVKELIRVLEKYNLEADVGAITFDEHQDYYNFNNFYSSNGSTPKGATEVIVFIKKREENE